MKKNENDIKFSNFSEFIEAKKIKAPQSPFTKEDLEDFFIKSDSKEVEEDIVPNIEPEFNIDYIDDQSYDIPIIEDPSTNEDDMDQKQNDSRYPIYLDKSENFICDVSVEGASLKDTKVKLLLESSEWNIFFDGIVENTGKCTIPIKKVNILSEGLVGKIRLEVIAENSVFYPWEEEFICKMSKKVIVKVQENSNFTKKQTPIKEKERGVQVKIRKI
jgi:hypothetical protein